ncbi:Uma2 family endonuclease [Chamaesiphon sp. VAR_69_metabat_338]|uniref:Uma2 family endonuclease n=1 Tax=Chamaesiphon sp. VAR_69_metabat_338 TaxID=2964704 RepID=UPI00286D9591|nr:Uma2 family endonuclease [Chamaesiphon sp. VAR_69_metabat_338]
MAALTLNLSSIAKISRSQFRQIANDNPEMKLERDKQGNLIVMAPTGGETGNWNSELNLEVGLWNRTNQTGKTFDSSTGFELPNGGDRSPDVAWIPLAKWEALTPEERRGFLPLCPDFAIELMSRSDSWVQTQAKMAEYMESGCRLAWLLDPKGKRAVIYRLGQPPEFLNSPDSLSGEDVLPGFILDARFLWS